MRVEQLDTGRDTLSVRCRLTALEPQAAFAFWTRPELLIRWWPKQAEVDGRVGGEYHLRWPEMHWHLHGRYSEFDPGSVLVFTWSWEHEPDAPVTRVRIHFEPQPAGGTLLTITHGPYDDTTGSQEMRAGHIEGWTYFLGRLQDVSASG